jgi:ABC-type Fe3+-siderophore transport system permease subunit
MLLSVASLDAPFTIAFDARMVVLALLLCLGSAFYLMHLTGMRRPHPTRLVIGGMAIGALFNAAFHIALKSMTLVPPLLFTHPC